MLKLCYFNIALASFLVVVAVFHITNHDIRKLEFKNRACAVKCAYFIL